jgi:hypothetical protein
VCVEMWMCSSVCGVLHNNACVASGHAVGSYYQHPLVWFLVLPVRVSCGTSSGAKCVTLKFVAI